LLRTNIMLQPKKKRKNRYVPDLAAAYFKPTEDWSVKDARTLYEQARFPFEVDHVIYEDCISQMQMLPEESVDVVVADPPFGLGFNGRESIYNRDERLVKEGYEEIKEGYEEFTVSWLREVRRVLKKTGSAWIFSGWTHVGEVLNALKHKDVNLPLVNHVIWRYQFGAFTRRKFVSSHYHVLFVTKTQKYYFNKIMHYPLDVWDIKRTYRRGEVKNATKLPERLVARCIEFTSRPGALVLDPFMGNGTTAVAAKGTFRHFLGFEKNPAMKEVIDMNLGAVRPGFMYTPYSERKEEIVERAKKKYGAPRQDVKLSDFK
jgi:site-specific DNA-methyltransferase (adenine-specific)